MTESFEAKAPTRERLIVAAARAFRRKGFHGAGLAEILAEAEAPKGSLYHHFPNGKTDLALAAADWASEAMAGLIDRSFAPAPGWREGVSRLTEKLARLFERSDAAEGCPVSGILLEGGDDPARAGRAAAIYESWSRRSAVWLAKRGCPEPEATAELFLLGLQGAWVLARARRSADPIRRLPALIFGH